MAKDKTETVYTGLYWACPANPVKHKLRPTAVPIQRKNKHYIRCGCGTITFFSKDWKDSIGLTDRQCAALGLDIPESVIL